MNHKNKRYEYFLNQYPEFEYSISRFQDYIRRVIHNNEVVETRFLSNIEQTILEKMVDKNIKIIFWGGFENANYRKAELTPIYFNSEQLPEVVVLTAKFNKDYHDITHRDVLGTILNQGIKRNRIGDIVVKKDEIYVACDKQVVVMLQQISKIKRAVVQFEETDKKLGIEPNFLIFEIVVSSLRLDLIVAHIAHLARTKAVTLIDSNYVKVNEVIQQEKTFLCKQGDVIVIRGYGKYILNEVKSTTRKNNLILQIKKYV